MCCIRLGLSWPLSRLLERVRSCVPLREPSSSCAVNARLLGTSISAHHKSRTVCSQWSHCLADVSLPGYQQHMLPATRQASVAAASKPLAAGTAQLHESSK